MKKIAFALTGSFCTIEKALIEMMNLKKLGYDLTPIVSPKIIDKKWDNRFSTAKEVKEQLEDITEKRIISTIVEAETLGPKNKMDAIIIAPATGNFIAKTANGITDNTVRMATKATLRNGSPAILAMATNDGLSLNASNIGSLLNSKNIFFVPYRQDNYIAKPSSLVSDFTLIPETLEKALEGKQLQPVVLEPHPAYQKK